MVNIYMRVFSFVNVCRRLAIASIYELTAICVFARTSFLKGFFVRKKAKTQNAFNKRFGKKPAEGFQPDFVLLSCFGLS